MLSAVSIDENVIVTVQVTSAVSLTCRQLGHIMHFLFSGVCVFVPAAAMTYYQKLDASNKNHLSVVVKTHL